MIFSVVLAAMILVCAGSGLAQFRGFVQDRALRARTDGSTPGKILLFFGCAAPDVDDLYREEFNSWQAHG